MTSRVVIVLLTLAAGCSRRDETARRVPDRELTRSTPSATPAPQCNPACEAGAACVEGLCAEPIDWTRKALPSTGSCPVGERHAVTCAKALSGFAPVWGSDVYTADSSICRAALHAGKITAAGGDVVYEIRPGRASYDRTSRNGVTTDFWAAYDCSFVFTSKGCAAGLHACGGACANFQTDAANCGSCGVACAVGDSCRKGVCSPGLDADYTTTPGNPCTGTRMYACPPVGGAVVGTVWGTSVYTNDSSVCGAALHAGVIAATSGGNVTIEMLPGLPTYAGTTSHGIASRSWGSWSCSFRFK